MLKTGNRRFFVKGTQLCLAQTPADPETWEQWGNCPADTNIPEKLHRWSSCIVKEWFKQSTGLSKNHCYTFRILRPLVIFTYTTII